MKKILLFFVFLSCVVPLTYGQSANSEAVASLDIDEIEVNVKEVKLSPKGDSVVIVLSLQSYLKIPRELKINSFSTGLVNPEGKTLFYDSMKIGNVRIALADRQNYIHYLLTRDEPVLFTVVTPNWQKRWGKPQQFRLTLEDHLEEGKFLQVDIPL